MRIQKLSSQVSDKIAAGEVIERPASVVKELVENSIDAGSDKIHVEIKAAGKEFIRVSDNGCGIYKQDAQLAFERHATGKIREIGDIYQISTMGFRGEALSSIAAVSRIELISRSESDEFAYRVNLENGMMSSFKPTGANRGTSICVKDLFYNTPARFAFLKSDRAENNAIREIVDKLAIANPHISFSLSVDNQLLYRTDGRGKLLNTLHRIYGDEFIQGLVEVDFSDLDVKMSGYLSLPEFVKGTKKWQMIFINHRYVSDNLVEQKINEYFSKILGSGKFPVFAINVQLPSNKVDVNIHPTKREVLFKDSDKIQMLTLNMLDDVFSKVDMSAKLRLPEYVRTDDVVSADEPESFEPKKALKKEDVIDHLYKSFYQKGQSQYVIADEEALQEAQDFLVAAPKSDYLEEVQKNDDLESIQKEDVMELSEKPEKIGFDPHAFFQEVKSKKHEQPKLNVDLLENVGVYDNMNVIAQVFDSYILTSSGDALYFINQHDAHERILYESIILGINEGKLSSQILLMMEKLPEDILLSDKEIAFFKRFSIIIEAYPKGFYLRELPVVANKVLDIKAAISFVEAMHAYFCEHEDLEPDKIALDELTQYYESVVYGGFENIVRKEISKMACNTAIKENQILSLPDMNRILEGLKKVKLPYTSIHGDVMLTKLSKDEIFKR